MALAPPSITWSNNNDRPWASHWEFECFHVTLPIVMFHAPSNFHPPCPQKRAQQHQSFRPAACSAQESQSNMAMENPFGGPGGPPSLLFWIWHRIKQSIQMQDILHIDQHWNREHFKDTWNFKLLEVWEASPHCQAIQSSPKSLKISWNWP